MSDMTESVTRIATSARRWVHGNLTFLRQVAVGVATDPRAAWSAMNGLPHAVGSQQTDWPPPADITGCAHRAHAHLLLPMDVEDALSSVADLSRWPAWFALHESWPNGEPEPIHEQQQFEQRLTVMGVTIKVRWTVTTLSTTVMVLKGVAQGDISIVVRAEAVADDAGVMIRLDLGAGGGPLRGAIGAAVTRIIQDSLIESTVRLSAVITGQPLHQASVVFERTGQELPPTTPVIVGVGQFVNRHPGDAGHSPAQLCATALRSAEKDCGTKLLRHVDAIYGVDCVSWEYPNLAASVADALGLESARTVMSVKVGGDAGQRMVNAAAQAIAEGEAHVIAVCGAEAGATSVQAERDGHTLNWSEKSSRHPVPDAVIGVDRAGGTSAESGVGLTAPIFVYPMIESAIAAKFGRSVSEQSHLISRMWSRYSAIAASRAHAWTPTAWSANDIETVTPTNRMVSYPYTKRLCAILDVDQASGIIVCSAAAAQRAGIPQDLWVFPLAGSSAYEEWNASERADLAASPAIAAAGRAVLDHAEVDIADVRHVDLYSCFPSAVEIAAMELGLPVDDPARPLTVTGGLAFHGGPGNNYGGHAVATMVEILRRDSGSVGLTTSLGWYLTKHAVGIYSTDPPQRPYQFLHPPVERPASRPVVDDYEGPAVLESFTIPYSRAGVPEAAILTAIAPTGERVLIRTAQDDVIKELPERNFVRCSIEVCGGAIVTLGDREVRELPVPPPKPVLVERRGPITVISLNRPGRRNAIDRRTAVWLERALDQFEHDPDSPVAVLTGADGIFSAGMDLTAAARGEYPIGEHRGALGILESPPSKPLIAAVEGPALAGGCELALACDLIVASDQSTFGIPEAKRGLVAAGGGVLRLAERLPRAVALQMALTGDPIDAQRAYQLGLVNEIVPVGTAVDAALELANAIAANAPLSLALSKRIVDEHLDWAVQERLDCQTAIAAPALTSADATEGMLAFAEKRAPKWSGR